MYNGPKWSIESIRAALSSFFSWINHISIILKEVEVTI